MDNTCKPKIIMKKKIVIRKTDVTRKTKQWSSCSANIDPGETMISFDVGIINLAYAVMKMSDEIIIYDWGIINLASGNNKLTCSASLKSGVNKGKTCKKKAHFINGKKGLCATHGKNSNDCERNITVDNVTELELKTTLYNRLDALPILMKGRTVLVEHQPLHAREKIKSVGHALFDYFVMRGVIDHGYKYRHIGFVDAKNKLTVYDGPPISCHLKTQYSRNKWYGLRYSEWILRDKPELLQYLLTHKKKDDLADCLLQAIWYSKHKLSPSNALDDLSDHQKLVYKEGNLIKYKKIRPYAPKAKSLSSGRLTLSNVKYLIKKGVDTDILKKSIFFYFGDIEMDKLKA